jgi:hypothetical protein
LTKSHFGVRCDSLPAAIVAEASWLQNESTIALAGMSYLLLKLSS